MYVLVRCDGALQWTRFGACPARPTFSSAAAPLRIKDSSAEAPPQCALGAGAAHWVRYLQGTSVSSLRA